MESHFGIQISPIRYMYIWKLHYINSEMVNWSFLSKICHETGPKYNFGVLQIPVCLAFLETSIRKLIVPKIYTLLSLSALRLWNITIKIKGNVPIYGACWNFICTLFQDFIDICAIFPSKKVSIFLVGCNIMEKTWNLMERAIINMISLKDHKNRSKLPGK